MPFENKTLQLIDRLSYLEAKHFRDFLASPYFNKETELSDLFEILRHRAGSPALEWDRDAPASPLLAIESREDIHRALFPKQPFDDLNIRRMLSVLLKLLLEFLEIEDSREDEVQRKLTLLPALRRRGVPKIYDYEHRRVRQILDQSTDESGRTLLQRHQLEAEYSQFLEEKKERSATINLEPAVQRLDEFYFAHKLRHLCAILNYKSIVDVEMQGGMETELLAYLDQQAGNLPPGIRIYRTIYAMLKSPGEEGHYRHLTGLLDEFAAKFPAREARDMYAYAQNFCIKCINRGKSEFLQELFALYNQLLEKEILLEKGHLSPWDYKNITVVALRLEAYDWAENFIETYQDKLEPRFRENAHAYNLAKLEFYRKNYSRVLRLLQQVDYDDVFYALDSRVMLLKTYFELDEVEPLYSLIDSFRVFLRRNKLISDRHRRNYLNLIKFTKKLAKIRPSEKAKIDKIRAEVQAADHLADVNWLSEKIAELD